MTQQHSNKLTKYLIGIIIILVLLLSGTGYVLHNKNINLNILEQNIKAKNDSLRTTVNKIGNLEKAKQVLITKNKDLGEYNSELKDELDKEKGKVYNLTQIIATINGSVVEIPVEIPSELIVYPDSTLGINWKNDTIYDKYNFRKLSGVSKFKYDSTGVTNLGTTLLSDKIGFNLITGLRELNGNLEIFVRSDYPGFNVTKLDGAIINPKKNPVFKKFVKKKRWHFGPMIGVGISSGLEFTPIIGIGGMYSIFSL